MNASKRKTRKVDLEGRERRETVEKARRSERSYDIRKKGSCWLAPLYHRFTPPFLFFLLYHPFPFFSSFSLLSFFFRPMVTPFFRREVVSYFIFHFISTYHSCRRKNDDHWGMSRNRCEISLESRCFKKFFGIYGEYRLKNAFGRTSDFREIY